MMLHMLCRSTHGFSSDGKLIHDAKTDHRFSHVIVKVRRSEIKAELWLQGSQDSHVCTTQHKQSGSSHGEN